MLTLTIRKIFGDFTAPAPYVAESDTFLRIQTLHFLLLFGQEKLHNHQLPTNINSLRYFVILLQM